MKNTTILTNQVGVREAHAFHILGLSKLPIFVGSLVGLLALALIAKLQYSYSFVDIALERVLASGFYSTYTNIGELDAEANFKLLGLILVLVTVIWAGGSELVVEATHQGYHTTQVQTGIKGGFLLFLLSEAMLFFPFFWSFFHGTLSPSVALGGIWPGVGVNKEVLEPHLLPLVNTAVLLSSGMALVAAHRAIVGGFNKVVLNGLGLAALFGILFSGLQYLEYGLTLFTITDGLYGSAFFMLTGLHGFHVIVGTGLLIVAYGRSSHEHFTRTHHVGFETAAGYGHFVDVIWLGVFSCVYVWAVTAGL